MSTDKQASTSNQSSNQLTPHPYAEVIKAWADGKTIQYQLIESSPWSSDPLGVWLDYNEQLQAPAVHISCYQWRIKPESKTGWINLYSDDTHSPESGIIYPDKLSAIKGRDTTRKCIACIEITYTEGEGL